MGMIFERIVQRVVLLLDMLAAEVSSLAKRRAVAKACGMVCYWAEKYPGINQTGLARNCGFSRPAVCAAVQNGQKIVEENKFRISDNS
jgi:hypothetical protein